MPLPLSEIFPDEDYRFHLTIRKGDLADFFSPTDPAVVAERRRWIKSDPERYVAGSDDAAPLLKEFEAFARDKLGRSPASAAGDEGLSRLAALGGELEPDFVLLAADAAGVFRVCGGAVCFPTSWALTEKMGLTLDEVHGVVPGLNPALGPTISQFLQKLKVGAAYERSNWGLAATPELNLHPALARPRLSLPLNLEHIWVRVEDQILAALTTPGGILFGIRLRVLPLGQILDDGGFRSGFHRALKTMPDALAAYKGIAPIRDDLLILVA